MELRGFEQHRNQADLRIHRQPTLIHRHPTSTNGAGLLTPSAEQQHPLTAPTTLHFMGDAEEAAATPTLA